MATYTVHLPPAHDSDAFARAEKMLLVNDGFQMLALIAPPVWFLVRRLWLPAIAYVGVIAVAEALFWLFSVAVHWQAVVMAAGHLVLAFEASEIWRWSLGRAGWSEVGSVSGSNRDDCEQRVLNAWLALPASGEPSPVAR